MMGKKKKEYYIKKDKSLPNWKIVEGSTPDDIVFRSGDREIGFDEWLKEEYK